MRQVYVWIRSQNTVSVLWFIVGLTLPLQLGKHWFLPFSYVSGVRIDYLAIALYLSDIAVILLLFWRRSHVRQALLDPRIQFILFLLSVNCLFSLSKGIALYKFVKIIEWILLFIVARSDAKTHFRSLLLGLVIISGVETSLALAQLYLRHSLQGVFYWLGERRYNIMLPDIAKARFDGFEFLRPYATFSHPNSMGGFYALITAWLLAQLKWRRVDLVLFSLSIVLVFLSFSRIAWLALVCAMLWRVLIYRQRSMGFYVAVFVFTLTLLGAAFLLKGDVYSLDKRLRLTQDAASIIVTYPIFGVGIGSYVLAQSAFPHPYAYFFLQPVHNVPLLFIAEVGVFTSIIFAWCARKSVKTLFNIAIVPLLIVLFITSTFDHYWWSLQQNWLLSAVLLGFSLGQKTQQPPNS